MKRFDLPPLWMAGAGLLMGALAGIAPWPGYQMPLLGSSMMLTAIVIMGWTAFWFWRKKTTLIPNQAPLALVTEGPMRFSRNPIYAADTLLLFGWGFWLGSLAALIMVPLFAFLIERRFIREEETRLRHAFGAAFETYAKRVRRWL